MQVLREWYGGFSGAEQNLLLAVLLVVGGLVLGAITGWFVRRLLLAFDVDDAVEGTAFERTARRFGSSTVAVLAEVCGLFVFVAVAMYAAQMVGLLPPRDLTSEIGAFLPRLFIAVLVVIIGLLVGDKAELVTGERLKSIKLPEATIIPRLVRFSILYVAALIALSQLGIATGALLVLLAAYAFGLFFLGGLAFKDLLASAAAGIYLLLTEPYSIGDEVAIDGRRGIVQEVTVFVTRVENDDEEYIVPNHAVLDAGVTRIRE